MDRFLQNPCVNLCVAGSLFFWTCFFFPLNLLYIHILTKAYMRNDNTQLIYNICAETYALWRTTSALITQWYQYIAPVQNVGGTAASASASTPLHVDFVSDGREEAEPSTVTQALSENTSLNQTTNLGNSSSVDASVTEKESADTLSDESSGKADGNHATDLVLSDTDTTTVAFKRIEHLQKWMDKHAPENRQTTTLNTDTPSTTPESATPESTTVAPLITTASAAASTDSTDSTDSAASVTSTTMVDADKTLTE